MPSLMNVFAVLALILLAALSYLHRHYSTSSESLPFPPGPRRSFLTGCTLNIPFEKPWLTYSNWAKEYGTYGSSDVFLTQDIQWQVHYWVFEFLEKEM
ncbi:hypothetical protein BT96DRAFT_1047111 [Gymnopus androsaceus JB14]|uniref:Uncharacterized protein n=1 Tax=Gymnopus androsaceus JB14 TaxID=1447944 RepID=A0A6A4HAL7_9AGAR|nr:hypothetical protein BT96DRAFT_1047111 [Gymnopus androsaceus JB14]